MKRLNKTVHGSEQFTNYCKLSNSIIDQRDLYECFMKRLDELIEGLSFNFSFTDCVFKILVIFLKMTFVLPMFYVTYFFAVGLPILKVNVGSSHICLLKMQVILFH